MKTLIVMRHAKSSWEQPALADIDRPLNKRGRRDAPFMGKMLQLKGVRPGIIFASPAVRTLSTAQSVAEELEYPVDHIKTEKGLYEASAQQVLDIVQSWTDPVDNVLLIGHNPGLTDMVNQLTCAEIENIPTAGIVSIDFDVDHWKDVQGMGGSLRYFEYPRKYMQ